MLEDEAKESRPVQGKRDSSPLADDEVFVDASYLFVDGAKNGRKLPQWLDHFNARDLKVLFKCSLAVWILTLFIFIDATLKVLGQAAFFACIVLFIMPPSGVVFIHVLTGCMVCVGLALGWAWGVITMKAALATRPQADLLAQYRHLQQSAPQNTTNVGQASGQTSYAQIAIFEGFMLDTRVTVTYFCMMGLFVYLLARIRVIAPKLTLVALFATVVADIYLTTAPLIPTFQGTIPKSIIIPAAIAVGVGAVCNMFVFPQSTSHIVLDGIKDVLAPMTGFVHALAWHFGNPKTRFDRKQLQRLKSDILAAYQRFDSSNDFLPMDFSYGRWSPEDISSLQEPLRQVFVAFGELMELSISREEARTKESALREAVVALDEKDARSRVAYHQIARTVEFRDHALHPDTDEMIAKTFDVLSASAVPLLQAWQRALEAITQALNGVSGRESATALQNHQDALASLTDVQEKFEASTGHSLLAPHSHLFDAEGNVLPTETTGRVPPLFGLMTGLLYQERIINLSTPTVTLLQRIVDVEQKRSKSRLWLPKGLQRLFSYALSTEETPTTIQGPMDLTRTVTAKSHQDRKRKPRKRLMEKPEIKETNSAAARLEAMRTPTGRQRHRASTILLTVINWFTNDEGLHALRTLVVTLALAIPAVITSTSGFYYREKGMWALVMGQMALVPYASDFVSGLLIRTAGTVFGGVIGLACWYIGAGSGPGNAYGLAAVMAVAITLMMWWRLFSPPEHMTAGIMLTSTMFMVVAYSWVDTHIPSYGDPGVGYEVFWRRIVLVLVGFGAATIVTFIPRPVSGGRHYRQLLSEQLSSVKDRYILFLSTWQLPPSDLIDVAEKEAIVSQELLVSLTEPINITKFEFSTSNIDSDTMDRTRQICTNLNAYVTQLILYSQKLPLALRTQFIRNAKANDERLVADVMAVLTVVQQSLVAGNPLPAVLPTPLVSKAMASRDRGPGGDKSVAEDKLKLGEYLSQEEGRQWVSAVNAFVRFLGAVDDLVLVVKSAVGEGSSVDLDALDIERPWTGRDAV